MSGFICPVCGGEFTDSGKSLRCGNGHCFDISRGGYVNLLPPRRSGQHGDGKDMVRARQSFLDKGYYNPLLDGLCTSAGKYAAKGMRILDAGCGECWYTAGLYGFLSQSGATPSMLGVDISRDALAAGAKRCGKIGLAVASVFSLPVADVSCDILLSLFAPFCLEQFRRVLREGGVLIRVIPLENHLWSLKKTVYEAPYKNEVGDCALGGFELIERTEIKGIIHLPCTGDIINLFTMTPYYYKTGECDRKKLDSLSSLDAETEFGILVYRKTK